MDKDKKDLQSAGKRRLEEFRKKKEQKPGGTKAAAISSRSLTGGASRSSSVTSLQLDHSETASVSNGAIDEPNRRDSAPSDQGIHNEIETGANALPNSTSLGSAEDSGDNHGVIGQTRLSSEEDTRILEPANERSPEPTSDSPGMNVENPPERRRSLSSLRDSLTVVTKARDVDSDTPLEGGFFTPEDTPTSSPHSGTPSLPPLPTGYFKSPHSGEVINSNVFGAAGPQVEEEKARLIDNFSEQGDELENEKSRNAALRDAMVLTKEQFHNTMDALAALQEEKDAEKNARIKLEAELEGMKTVLLERDAELNVLKGQGAGAPLQQVSNEEESLTLLREEIAAKVASIEDLSSRLKVSESAQEHQASEVQRLSGQMQGLGEELAKVSLENEAIRVELQLSDQRANSVREKLSMAVRKGKEVVQHRELLKATLAEKAAELEGAIRRIQEMEAIMQAGQSADTRAIHEDLQQRLEHREQEIQQMQVRLDEAVAQGTFIEAQLAESQSRLAAAQVLAAEKDTAPAASVENPEREKLKQLADQMVMLESQLAAATERAQSAEVERATVLEELSRSKGEAIDLRKESEEAKENVVDTTRELDKATLANQQLQGELASLVVSTSERLKQEETKFAALTEELSTTRSEVEKLTEKLDDSNLLAMTSQEKAQAAEKELQTVRSRLVELEAEVTLQSQQIIPTQQELEKVMLELQNAEAKYASSAEAIHDLTSKLLDTNLALEGFQVKFAEKEAQVKELESKLLEEEEMKKNVEEANRVNVALLGELEIIKNELALCAEREKALALVGIEKSTEVERANERALQEGKKVEELSKDLEAAQVEVANLQKMHSETCEKLSKAVQMGKKLEKQREELKVKLKEAQSKGSTSEMLMEQLQKAQEDGEIREQEFVQLQDEVQKLLEKLSEKDKQVIAAQAAIKDLEDRLALASEKAIAQGASTDELRHSLEKMQSAYESSDVLAASLRAEIEEIHSESKLRDADWQTQVGTLQDKLREESAKGEVLLTEAGLMQTQLMELRKALANREQDITTLQREVQGLLAVKERELAGEKEAVRKLENDLMIIKSTQSELETGWRQQIGELASTAAAKEEELQAAIEREAVLKKQLDMAQEARNNLSEEVEKVQAGLDGYREELAAREGEVGTLQKEVQRLQKQVEEASKREEEGARAKQELAAQDSASKSLTVKVSELEKSLSAATKAGRQQKDRLAKLRVEKEQLEEELKVQSELQEQALVRADGAVKKVMAEVEHLELEKVELLTKVAVAVEGAQRAQQELQEEQLKVQRSQELQLEAENMHVERVRQADARVGALEKDVAAERAMGVDLREQLQARDMLLVSLRDRKEALERETQQLAFELAQAKATIAEQEEALRGAQAAAAEAEDAAAASEIRAAALAVKAEEAVGAAEAAHGAVEDAAVREAAAKRALEEAQAQQAEALAKLRDAEDALVELESRSAATKAALEADMEACKQESADAVAAAEAKAAGITKKAREAVAAARTKAAAEVATLMETVATVEAKSQKLSEELAAAQSLTSTAVTGESDTQEGVAAASKKVTELEEKLAEAEQRATKADAIVEEMKMALAAAEARVADLGHRVAVQDAAVSEKENSASQEGPDKGKLQDQVAGLREKLQRAVKKGKGIEQQKLQLEKEFASQEAELAALRASLATSHPPAATLKEVADLRTALASKEELLNGLEEDRARLRRNLEAVEEASRARINEVQEHAHRLETSLEGMKRQLAAAEEERVELLRVQAHARERAEALESLATQRLRQEELATQIAAAAEGELARAKKEVAEQRDELLKLEKMLGSAHDERARLLDDVEGLRDHLASERSSLAQTLEQAEAAARKATSESERAAGLEATLKMAQAQAEVDMKALADAQGVAKEAAQRHILAASEEIARLVSEVADLQQELQQARKEVQEMREKEVANARRAGEEEVSELKDAHQRLQQQMVAKQVALEAEQKRLAALEEGMASLQRQLDTRDHEVDEARAETESLWAEVDGLKRQLAERREQLESAQEAAQKAQEDLVALQEDSSSLREAVKRQSAETASKLEIQHAAQRQVAGLQAELEKMEREKQNLAAGYSEATAKLAALGDVLKGVQEKSAAAVAEAEGQVQAQEADMVRFRDDSMRLRVALGSREAELARLRQQVELLQDSQTDADAEAGQLREEVAGLQHEEVVLKDALDEREGQLAEARQELQAALQQLQAVRSALGRKEAALEEAWQQLAEAQQGTQTAAQAPAGQSQLDALLEELSAAQAECESARAAGQWRDAELDELRKETARLAAEADRWRQNAGRREAQLEEARAEMQESLSESQALRDALDDKDAEVSRAQELAAKAAEGARGADARAEITRRELEELRRKTAQQLRSPLSSATSSAGINPPSPRGTVRKNPTLRIDIDSPTTIASPPDRDHGEDQGMFRTISRTYPSLPRVLRPAAAQIDRLCLIGGHILMGQPAARLLMLSYWIALHIWMAAMLSTVRV